MYSPVFVYIGRTTTIKVHFGFDVSEDTITSHIKADVTSDEVLAEWDVTFLTDGTDGELIFTLDDADVEDIPYTNGVMDIKRVSGGEPLKVFDDVLPVVFKKVVTI